MSSGFVSSSTLEEERQKRQDEWEKVRKPEDPQTAPEPEICNKTLFEQLRDNREAKQAEIAESKKFKNMIRGIDEDESDFLSQIDDMKELAELQKKKEEEQLLKEMASQRVVAGVDTPTLSKITPVSNGTKPVNTQASILSAAIKRKAASDKKEDDNSKMVKIDEAKPAVSAQRQIGTIPGLVNYEASSDSDSDSSDSEPGYIPMLKTAKPKKQQQG